MTKVNISAEVMDAVVNEIRAEVRRREEVSRSGEHCRVCGGRDHQRDENVIERSVKKDNEIYTAVDKTGTVKKCHYCGSLSDPNQKEVYTITHDQVEKISELQGECDALKLDRDGYRQASLDWQRRAESAEQKVEESIRAIAHQTEETERRKAEFSALNERYAKNCGSERHAADCRRHIDALVKQMTGTEELLKKVSEERDSYKKSYEDANMWLSEEKDKHKKDNTMIGVNQPRSEVERLRVQLAGCGVAAQGGVHKEQLAAHDSYGWSPAYQSVLELRLRYDEAMQAIEFQKEKLKNKDDTTSLLVADVKKAKSGLLDAVARDDNKEIARLEKESKLQQKAATDLFNECQRLQKNEAFLRKDRDEWSKVAALRLSVIDAALKKLNLERFAYQGYEDLIEEIEKMPHMRPASQVLKEIKYTIPGVANTCTPPAQDVHSTCASCSCKTGAPRAEGVSFTLLRKEGDVETWEGRPIVTANGTKLSGAPTWPQYKAKRGPEMPKDEAREAAVTCAHSRRPRTPASGHWSR